MIAFRVDSHSVVPPYLQIVQQVERRIAEDGPARGGDQLPGAGGGQRDGDQSQHRAQGLPGTWEARFG